MAIEQWLVQGPKTIDIANVRSLRATLMNGSLNILAHDDGPNARVEISSVAGRELRVAIDGDALIIDHPRLALGEPRESARAFAEGLRAEVSVSLPRTAPVKVRAANAEVLVSGTRASVNVATTGGDQFLDGIEGPTRLASISGELSMRGQRGAVTARTVSGDLVLSGAIDNASVTTVTGATILDIAGTLPDHITASSASGSLTMRLPRDARPAYVLNTVSSRIDLDGERIPVQFGRLWKTPASDYEREMTDVRVTTVGGRITVVRGADTRAPKRLVQRTPVTSRDANLDAAIDERVRRAGESLGETGSEPGELPAEASSEATAAGTDATAGAAGSPGAGAADSAPERGDQDDAEARA